MAFPFSYYNSPAPSFNMPMAGGQYVPQVNMPTAPQTQAGGFVCRPVTSRAEAEVFQIPFDGSTTYFVDTSSGAIYAKAFDMNTGTAPIVTYTRQTTPAVRYATIDELNALRAELTGGAASEQ